jgi:hypothetical protein
MRSEHGMHVSEKELQSRSRPHPPWHGNPHDIAAAGYAFYAAAFYA